MRVDCLPPLPRPPLVPLVAAAFLAAGAALVLAPPRRPPPLPPLQQHKQQEKQQCWFLSAALYRVLALPHQQQHRIAQQ